MPETFDYKERYWYPHMQEPSRAIWERFVRQFPDLYDRVQYDVPCGSVPKLDTIIDGEKQTSVERLYRKKIDVVAYKDDQIDIIEIKPYAGASALGQVKDYVRLYVEDYAPPIVPKPIIITDILRSDMEKAAAAEGVLLVVV